MSDPTFKERLRVILVDFALVDRRREADRPDEENLMRTVAEILSLVRGIVPEKKHEGKHDGHQNDDNSWCYSCGVSDNEKEFTQNWNWNACRQAILNEIGEDNDDQE